MDWGRKSRAHILTFARQETVYELLRTLMPPRSYSRPDWDF